MGYKIGIIGDKESVMGFMAVGFTVEFASDAQAGSAALRRMAKENFAVLFVTEALAMQMEEEIARYRSLPTPAVIVLPGKEGSTGYGLSQVKKSVERAVGADVLFR